MVVVVRAAAQSKWSALHCRLSLDILPIRKRDLGEVAPDILQLGINVAATERPVRVGAVVILVACLRRFEAEEWKHQCSGGLARIFCELRDYPLRFMMLVRCKSVDRAPIPSIR